MISAAFLVAIPATTPRLGRLTACAVRAESLENLDADEWFGSAGSDPYATLKVNGEACSSTVLRDRADAVWNHCCDFGLQPEDAAVQVIVTDMDDRGDDDLIGLACTSVGTGYRWLDLIRHGVAYVVG